MNNKGQPQLCITVNKEANKTYAEYYFGEKDRKKRRNGKGQNHWTAPESIEWYNGNFVRDAMNGYGDYRWRYRGVEGAFVTYEGYLLANALHGYGVMSYPDGRTFTGLYYKNVRWGPGVEYYANLKQDVGFWRGTQLIRLAWRPQGPSVALDLITGPGGKDAVAPFRVLLAASSKKIGETNSAIELLKQVGAEPILAAEKWPMLYSRHCTDLNSTACHTDVFLKDFYDGRIMSLEETHNVPENQSQESPVYQDVYYAWNNNHTMLHMMKHCFKHEHQRAKFDVKLPRILNGPRKRFRPAGRHETDCRKLLMACYTGQIESVARLINESDVYPDVSDIQGNTALMYAACGDQPGVIHFLVEAGANVNSFNDVCLTPLGAALMRYACVEKDIPPNAMVQAVLPQKSTTAMATSPQESRVEEWLITREISIQETLTAIKPAQKSISRMKSVSSKKILGAGKRSEKNLATLEEQEFESEESISDNEDDKKTFTTINNAYNVKVCNTFSGPNVVPSYLFSVKNMIDDIVENLEVPKDSKIKAKDPSKNFRAKSMQQKSDVVRVSKDKILDSSVGTKLEMLNRIVMTIQQLLADGADPRLVRCPQPALYTAVLSGSAELMRHLIQHGANVNETFSEGQNYSPLAIAISGALTVDTLDMIRALLENGADANIRLDYPEVPGPNLLHAILTKKTESGFQDDIVNQIIELLLDHHCNPYAQFVGKSAVEVAMNKRIELLDVFMKSPNVDLNKIINNYNQTILVKFFSLQYFRETAGMERFPTLTNLLLYGADPLLECHDRENTYGNLFVYAQETLENLTPLNLKRQGSAISGVKIGKGDSKSQHKAEVKTKGEKPQAKGDTKGGGKKAVVDEASEYTSLISLMTECVSMLHVRWVQAKLMKELIAIIYKYQHRQWNMIMKEHNNQKGVGLWLNPQRCLEIWDILKTTKKKIYTNDRILKFLLYIVQFYNRRVKNFPSNAALTAPEKTIIEMDVGLLLNEHKAAAKLAAEAEAWKRMYVKPELEIKAEHKYKVCFECALPLKDDSKIICFNCELISFCNLECIKKNIERKSYHPCNEYLAEMYFPPIFDSTADLADKELEIVPTPSSIKASKPTKHNKAVSDLKPVPETLVD